MINDSAIYYSGIWSNPFGVRDKRCIDRAIQITKFGLKQQTVPNITCFDTAEEILEASIFANCEFTVIQCAGAWAEWNWLQATNDWLNSQSDQTWLVAGHILDFRKHGAWYWLHPQYMIIRNQTWQDLGRPMFGVDDGIEKDHNISICHRSDDNVHDDYTPLWLRTGQATENLKFRTKIGWNLINESLLHGLEVVNIPNSIRRLKGNTYVEHENYPTFIDICENIQHGIDPDKSAGLDSSQVKYATELYLRAHPVDGQNNGVYVINNETLNNVTKIDLPRVDHLISVAAGFKPNFVLHHVGFNANTKITWCDISKPALDFKRHLANTWDGIDLQAAWDSFPDPKRHLNREVTSFSNQVSVNRERWKISNYQWYDHWQQFRTLQSEYLHMNLIYELDTLLDIIDNSAGQYIVVWISNLLVMLPSMIKLEWHDTRGEDKWLIKFENRCRQIAKNQGKTVVLLDHQMTMTIKPDPDRIDQLAEIFTAATDFNYQQRLEHAVGQARYFAEQGDLVAAGRAIHNSGLPWLKMDWTIPHQEMLSEATALYDYFTEHRWNQGHRGWKSLALHGLRAAATQGWELYGYEREEDAPYDWTWVADRCPVTTAWIKSLSEYGNLHRVRYMLMEPLGYIEVHQDRPQHGLSPINIALNMPKGCAFTMQGYGAVPFNPGDAYAVDIGNMHTVVNDSDQQRFHIIIHGGWSDEYLKSLWRSASKLVA